jgi:rhamnopyranosyl-N-acetylglucosaminyl-diphospho-decaprenol beta-1,3/1,4-galactofuranosyltransferase
VTDEAIVGHPPVVAVPDTCNRRTLLTKPLTMIGKGTRPPDVLTVVDNASTDGPDDVIRAQFQEMTR